MKLRTAWLKMLGYEPIKLLGDFPKVGELHGVLDDDMTNENGVVTEADEQAGTYTIDFNGCGKRRNLIEVDGVTEWQPTDSPNSRGIRRYVVVRREPRPEHWTS